MSSWGRSRTPSIAVVADRPWADPELDRLADYLAEPTVPPEGKVAATLDWLAAARPDPERATQLAELAADRLHPHLDALARARSEQRDPASAADLIALSALATCRAAWKVRGSGVASTVSQEAGVVFLRMLEDADELGSQALQLVAHHPAAALSRLVSARGLGVPEAEWWHRFEVARAGGASLFAAHQAMLQAMCAKWHGSNEVMLDFARQVAAAAPVGDPVSAVLPMAHFELAADAGPTVAAERARDQSLVTAAADRWLAGGPAALAHPRAVEAHNIFGWYFAGDRPRAAFHLSNTRARLAAPFTSYRDCETVFRKALGSAGIKG